MGDGGLRIVVASFVASTSVLPCDSVSIVCVATCTDGLGAHPSDEERPTRNASVGSGTGPVLRSRRQSRPQSLTLGSAAHLPVDELAVRAVASRYHPRMASTEDLAADLDVDEGDVCALLRSSASRPPTCPTSSQAMV
jgi:hypothetical protein